MVTISDLAYRIQHAREAVIMEVIEGHEAVVRVEMPSNAKMLMALAEATMPCPYTACHPPEGLPRIDIVCPVCQEANRVPRFPTLREPCDNLTTKLDKVTGQEQPDDSMVHIENCRKCRGRGWVPIQHDMVEKVWEVVAQFGPPRLADFSDEIQRRMLLENESALTATLAAVVLMLAEEEKP